MIEFLGQPWVKSSAITLVLVIAIFILGLLFKRLLVTKIAAFTLKTTCKWDEVVDAALGRIVIPLSIVLGFMASLPFWHVPPKLHEKLLMIPLALIVAIIARFLMILTRKLIATYDTEDGRPAPTATLTKNIINTTILVLGFFSIMQLFGISVTPLVAAFGIGGIGVSLAAQDTLSNLFAGVYISLGGNLRGGHYIKLGSGEEGYIVDITWRETHLKMKDNNLMAIPNATMAKSVIMNYNLPTRDVWLSLDFSVSGKNDLVHVEQVTLDVAKNMTQTVPEAIPNIEPQIRFNQLTDSTIKFEVLIGAKSYDNRIVLRHELIKRLYARYAEEKIILAS